VNMPSANRKQQRGVNDIVEYLVDQGAHLDARTVEGWTPWTYANGLSYSDFYKAQNTRRSFWRV